MKIDETIRINSATIAQQAGPSISKESKTRESSQQRDKVLVSDSSQQLALDAREKAHAFKNLMIFSSINGDIKEIPANYKCENLFKIELKANGLSGGISIFQSSSEEQYKVFEQWLNNNSDSIFDDEMQNIKEQIKRATSGLDELNSQDGYRGTSFESVFITEASKAALENINKTMIPEHLRKGFQSLVDEYVHFNENARDSIMERMTPNYMVIDIGQNTESYKYKVEIISDERKYYESEKTELNDKFTQLYSEKLNKEDFLEDIKKYVGSYYEKRYSTSLKKSLSDEVNDIIENLMQMM